MTPTRHYIVRVDFDGVHYGTVEPDILDVSYRDIHRTKRTIESAIGPMREVEKVGEDKSTLVLNLRSQGRVDRPSPRNARGAKGIWPHSTAFRLLDRHKHIRVLRPEDQEHIGGYDHQIAAKVAELEALREQRAEFVAKAWRRAEKVSGTELQQKAQS